MNILHGTFHYWLWSLLGTAKAATWQSGPLTGALYAGGIALDQSKQQVYITGSTYVKDTDTDESMTLSNCFLTALDATTLRVLESDNTYGSDVADEYCSSLASDGFSVYVVGSVADPGWLTDGASAPGSMKEYGFLLELEQPNVSNPTAEILLEDAASQVQYPRSIVADSGQVYIVSMVSMNPEQTEISKEVSQHPFPNWVHTQQYGIGFNMRVQKIGEDHSEVWSHHFMDESGLEIPHPIYIGSSVLFRDRVFIVGATMATGSAFGSVAPPSIDAETGEETRATMDGFITKLDAATGILHPTDSRNTARIGTHLDTFLIDVCADENSDPDHFYVVGATRVSAESGVAAGVLKIDVDTMTVVWSTPLPALASHESLPSSVYAKHCLVDAGNVYVAGNVHDDSYMENSGLSESYGMTDVFVAKLAVDDGAVEWVSQHGSDGRDDLAVTHAMVMQGRNIILFGNTDGSWFRTRSGINDNVADLFAIQVNSIDGTLVEEAASDFPVGTENNNSDTSSKEAPVKPPPEVITSQPAAPEPEPEPEPLDVVPYTGTETKFAYQMNGPVYAAGLQYNGDSSVMFTGSTYVGEDGTLLEYPQCYIAEFWPATGVSKVTTLGKESGVNGTKSSVPEACSALSFASSADHAYLAGGTEPGGLFTKFYVEDGPAVTQFGTVLQVGTATTAASQTGHQELSGGYLFQDAAVTYPVAIVADENNAHVYVASMSSTSDVETSDAALIDAQQFPDLTAWGYRRYGMRYYLQVSKLEILEPRDTDVDLDRLTLTDLFTQEYATEDSISVFPSGMIQLGDDLIIVGSTRGGGGVFGDDTGGSMDGFMLKINPADGTRSKTGSSPSNRINSANNKDEWILGVCSDPRSPSSFYVVGATTGYDDAEEPQPVAGTIHPFVMKISTETLVPFWTKQLEVTAKNSNPTDSSFNACAVSTEGIVFVGGVVKDGAVMHVEGLTSKGRDDIVVSALSTTNGELLWTQQAGTAKNDRVAQNGLAVDAFGDVVVLAHTGGKLYETDSGTVDDGDGIANNASTQRNHRDGHNVVIMTMSKVDGSYESPYVPQNSDGVIAFQTGPDVGPSYAGGLAYDPDQNAVVITGQTYGEFGDKDNKSSKGSCFLGVIPLSDFDLREQTIIGTEANPEACNVVALTRTDSTSEYRSVLIGTTGDGGLLTDTATVDGAQFGFLFSANDENRRFGGSVLDGYPIQYPVAMALDQDQGTTYVVRMNANDVNLSHNFKEYADPDYPNWTTGGFEKYGSSFFIVVERFTLTTGEVSDSFALDWSSRLTVEDGHGSDYASGAVIAKGTTDDSQSLIVVGSTRESPDNEAMDGFIAKMDLSDGSLVGDNAVTLISSSSGRDDWITNICNDPDDEDTVYIVGATMGILDDTVERADGDMTVHAYISKFSVGSMEVSWTKQFPIEHGAGAGSVGAAVSLGCAVVEGDSLLYVAGNIENGATMSNDADQQSSSGSDDIFVAQLNTRNGSVQWLKQVGSKPGIDRLARGNGIVTDHDGNAVILGDTTGELFRSRTQDTSDFINAFVMIFDKEDGDHELPMSLRSNEIDQTSVDNSISEKADKKKRNLTWVWVGIAIALVVFFALVFVLYRSHSGKGKSSSRRVGPGYGKVDTEEGGDDVEGQGRAQTSALHSIPPASSSPDTELFMLNQEIVDTDDLSVGSASTKGSTGLSMRL